MIVFDFVSCGKRGCFKKLVPFLLIIFLAFKTLFVFLFLLQLHGLMPSQSVEVDPLVLGVVGVGRGGVEGAVAELVLGVGLALNDDGPEKQT